MTLMFTNEPAGRAHDIQPDVGGPADLPRGSGWQVLRADIVSNAATVEALRALMARCDARHIAHDPVSLAGDSPASSKAALLVYYRDGRLVGYAPLTHSKRALRLAIGELTLYARPLDAYTLLHEPTIDRQAVEPAIAMRELLLFVAARRGSCNALFLEGLPASSPLFSACESEASVRSAWHILRSGRPYAHRLATLPATFAEYEAQLGSKSRKSLRYSRKKLAEHLDGQLRTTCFSEDSTVDRFVADAQCISRKTYQWHLLGLGLRDAPGLARQLKFMARQGWLRSYVLYCRNEPVAFILGYQYAGTYFYTDVGYDPDWARWSVGSVLQMEAMADLLASDQRPTLFDFSTGTGTHKERFSNTSRDELNLVLLPRGLKNSMFAALYRSLSSADAKLGALLERYEVKARLKKWLRRTATAKSSDIP